MPGVERGCQSYTAFLATHALPWSKTSFFQDCITTNTFFQAVVAAVAGRVAARKGTSLGSLRLLELGCGTSGLAPAVAAALPLAASVSASDFAPAVRVRALGRFRWPCARFLGEI